METYLNLERLPPEVLWHIGMYLQVPDLTACCGVSSTMRQTFSDDPVWKRHCNLELVQYLNETECLVEPSLEWSELWYQSSLYPLPRRRSDFMKHMNFVKNWREGKFEKEEINLGEVESYWWSMSSPQLLFFNNDYLFVHVYSITGVLLDEVWNVRETPFLHSRLNLQRCLLNDDLDEVHTVTIMGNKLVVGQYNIILVFDLNLENFSQPALVNAFLFDNSEEFSKTALRIVDNSVQGNNLIEINSKVNVATSGNLLIAAVTSFEPLTDLKLHIWDVSKGSKLREELIPNSGGVIKGLEFIENVDDFVIQLRVEHLNMNMYHYYGYNVSTLNFTNFSVTFNYFDFVMFVSDYLVGVSSRKVVLYSYTTSEKVFTKKCDEVHKQTVTTVGDDLLFGSLDSVVHVVNLRSLTVVNSIKLGFPLYGLSSILDRFVLVNSNHSEVWEIGKQAKKLYSFPLHWFSLSVFDRKKFCSRVAILEGNKIVILNFW